MEETKLLPRWERKFSTSRMRAIAIVETARKAGLLDAARVVDAINLRTMIAKAIEAHSSHRLEKAEAQLREDGYEECGACLSWCHPDGSTYRGEGRALYCSEECLAEKEPQVHRDPTLAKIGGAR